MAHTANPVPVSYEIRQGVAVLTMNNPPVNGIGLSIRQGLTDALNRATNDTGVSAIVIAGAGRMFCGGADISEFNTPKASTEPMSRTLFTQIEASTKPVIAAIHGMALGGGFELALGCHYRVAQLGSKIALPEITLGIIPGGGGTQRLTRLAGIPVALDLILSGRKMPAQAAKEVGCVDAIAEGDVVEAAIHFSQTLTPGELPTARNADKPKDVTGDITEARASAQRLKRNRSATLAAIEAIEASTTLPFEEALTTERRLFETLLDGEESKSIRHLFFAERTAMKVPGVTDKVSPETVQHVGIIGAGTMGGGIAMAFANAGIDVVLVERTQEALDAGIGRIRTNYDISAKRGRFTPDEVNQRMARIRPSTDMSDIAQTDLVIEAVFEDMEVKKTLFRQLDAICKPGAILASNTSRLNVNEIGAVTSRPEDVIGLHFFSPANVMKLLEVVRTDAASPRVIATCMDMARRIGKTPVLVGICEGFVGNRILSAYWREAWFLLEEGASPMQVDAAMRDFGMAMGPLATADLAGLDINWATRKRLAPTRPKHLRYCKVADRICEAGRFGQKTSAGFFRYEDGSRVPIPDPVVDAIIEDCAKETGIQRRVIPDQEIVERCVFAMVNEAMFILDEGIAQRASDIDVVYVNGYGFSAARGGPMRFAEVYGLDKVLTQIEQWAREQGPHWTPSPYFHALVEKGSGLSS